MHEKIVWRAIKFLTILLNNRITCGKTFGFPKFGHLKHRQSKIVAKSLGFRNSDTLNTSNRKLWPNFGFPKFGHLHHRPERDWGKFLGFRISDTFINNPKQDSWYTHFNLILIIIMCNICPQQ